MRGQPYVSNGNGSPGQSHVPLVELNRRAAIDKSEANKYAPKQWLALIMKVYEQGDHARRINDLQGAFVAYMRGCNIYVQILKRHARLNEIKSHPDYLLMDKRTMEVIDILESIKQELAQNDAMERFPPVSALEKEGYSESTKEEITLADLPSVPTHAPGRRMQMPEPPKVKRKPIAPVTPPPPPPLHGNMVPSTSSVTTLSNSSSFSINSQFESNSVKQLDIPPKSSFVFPPSLTVDPHTLAQWLRKRDNGPNILLLDVRMQSMYKEGCIRHKWMCQIEPLSLRPGVTSQKIEQSLVLNADEEQMLFNQRNKFDLVVYYDQDTRGMDEVTPPLRNLISAIYENEFQKCLQRMPMLLAGGFAAWQEAIGPRGVYSYVNPSQQPKPPQDQNVPPQGTHQQHWLASVVGNKGSANREPLHYTPFDYFTVKQFDGELQSMTRSSGPKPPLQGIFANALSSPSRPELPPTTMPVAPPNNNNFSPPTPTEESISAKYPDIKPNVSNGVSLQRRRTFIDNPFHGFTETANNNYDVPPKIPSKPTRPLPPPPPTHYSPQDAPIQRPSSAGPSAPALPSKPDGLKMPHPVVDSRYARISSENSVSQLSTIQIGKTGLKNLGNTCFMSSIIQCLSGTTPLARYLLTGMYKQHVNKTNPLGTGGVLVQSLAELIRTMWSGNYNFISPVTFRQALVRFAPQFAGTEQQDSQEFLMFLLDGLHEDVNVVLERPRPKPEDPEEEARFERLPDWQASGIAWSRYLERNESIIVSLFQGQYRSRLMCLTCNQTSTTYNTFMSLSLPIPTKGANANVSLYKCLDAFVKEETLDGDDAWNCPKCKKLRRSTKTLTLSRLPVVLLIHLKRFSFEGPFRNKLETMVDCPTRTLDLSSYVPNSMIPPNTERPSFKYDLYGVSNHYGSLTGGHYTAAVRDGYQGDWHYFDDTRFSMCEENKVVTRAAYNLFYVRSTVK
ncbi:hypothetical protein BJV82DRAFT_596797 [Fennellomyces sp. T-0311]|nr:hypothetical protein BJV82DRAFT_596797 [Fennellomyces sp. T-0311]